MADDHELPTPKRTDVLFAGDRTAWPMDAILDFRPGNDYVYREGYRRAARILSEYVATKGEVDFLVYPICHAYRHHVELSLKRLMILGCQLSERSLTEAEAKLQNSSHKLQELWKAFQVINAEAEAKTGIAPPPSEHLEGIEEYIRQLHEVDAGSFSFRYPLAKDGSFNLEGIPRINVGRFSDYMESLCGYLDGWDSYYADTIQVTNEMRSEQAADMYEGADAYEAGDMYEHGGDEY